MDLYFLILLFLSLAILLITCKLNFETSMEKHFKRKSEFKSLASSKGNNKDLKQCPFEINLVDLPADLRLRLKILDYNPNI